MSGPQPSERQYRIIGGEKVPLNSPASSSSQLETQTQTPRQGPQNETERNSITLEGDECGADIMAILDIHEGPESEISESAAAGHTIVVKKSVFSGKKSTGGSMRQGTTTRIGVKFEQEDQTAREDVKEGS